MFKTPLVLLLSLTASAANHPDWVTPNFHDLKIKTRTTEGLASPRETTWFLKGARTRVESGSTMRLLGRPGPDPGSKPATTEPMSVGIQQCDLRTVYRLHPFLKSYVKMTVPERRHPEEEVSPLEQMQKRNSTGPDVTITVATVDTGERRQMGNYEARRVKTTITVEPGKRATTKPGKTEVDGWYLDLKGMGCSIRDTQQIPEVNKVVFEVVRNNDHPTVKQLGAAQTGFAVEETSTRKEGGNVILGRIELLEFSEQPLDPSLFEPPPDYTQRTPGQAPHMPQVGPDGMIHLNRHQHD